MAHDGRSPPCAVFRRERSQNGHSLSALKSGLQKYIRRGMLDKALYCAGELHSFRWAPEKRHVGRVGTNFRHRLMIVFLEDVAQLGLWRRLDALLDRALSADDVEAAGAVFEWVRLLAAAPKSRGCSHARAVAQLRAPKDAAAAAALATARRLYPGIAALLAEHHGDSRRDAEEEWQPALLAALKERSRAACLWAWAIASEGASIRTAHGSRPEWRILKTLEEGCGPQVAALMPVARRWFRELQNTREAFLCWMMPLLAHINSDAVDCSAVGQQEVPRDAHAKFAAQEAEQLDGFVFDIHVRGNKGPAKGAGGLVRFMEEGCFVANESPAVDQVWKAFYNDRKRLAESMPPVGPPSATPQGKASEGLKKAECMEEAGVARGPEEPEASEGKKMVEAVAEAAGVARGPEEPEASEGKKMVGAVAEAAGVSRGPEEQEASEGKEMVEAVAEAAFSGEALLRESQLAFVVRAQLNTSGNRADVYFAREAASGRLVVVKGPFFGRTPVQRVLDMAQWKRDNGLPAVQCRAVPLFPDRWPDGVPLGLRNGIRRDQPAWFLIADSLVVLEEGQALPTRMHSSKLWPPTEVVDWTDAALFRRYGWDPVRQWQAYTEVEKKDYVLTLLARYMWGIGDQADRNFLRAAGRLHALDEDGRVPSDASVRLAAELRPNKAQLVRDWTNRNWATLEPQLAAWSVPEKVRGKWEDVKTRHKALALLSGHQTKRGK